MKPNQEKLSYSHSSVIAPAGRTVLAQVSLTEDNYKLVLSQLKLSLENLRAELGSYFKAVLIYQTVNPEIPEELVYTENYIEIIRSNVFSVSQARNTGIEYALSNGFDYILFHDAKVFYCREFGAMIREALEKDWPLCLGNVSWRGPTLHKGEPQTGARLFKGNIHLIPPSPVKDTYVWAYLFKISLIGGLRFNQHIGPGGKTVLNSGEDTLFLFYFFQQNPDLKIRRFPEARVFHPPRAADLSEHLKYAKAQGVLFRFFLSRKFHRGNWYFPLYLILFILVIFGRILSCRRNSLKTGRAFLNGLLDRNRLRKVFFRGT